MAISGRLRAPLRDCRVAALLAMTRFALNLMVVTFNVGARYGCKLLICYLLKMRLPCTTELSEVLFCGIVEILHSSGRQVGRL